MIDYSLAKELKDAGFPVGADGDHIGNGDGTAESAVYAPTLTELIEACGERFEYLRRTEQGFWIAGTYVDGKPREQGGPTPEEAVARLWLAIHKQN